MPENTQLKDIAKDVAKDVAVVLGIVLVFLILSQLFFGLWTPMYVVSSGSMESNMNVGDIIFVKSISRTEVVTLQDSLRMDDPRIKFNKGGDVILYRAYNMSDTVPIIHRAMYYVEEGEEMWPGGPAAPHAGYITKGDNDVTNPHYDQQTSISLNQPIKEEWIIGVSQFKIPYLGKIRLIIGSIF